MYYCRSNDAVGPFSRPNRHNGSPFPTITDQRPGPWIISRWTHPDAGLGTFFVMVDPPPGGWGSEGPPDSDWSATRPRQACRSRLFSLAGKSARAGGVQD